MSEEIQKVGAKMYEQPPENTKNTENTKTPDQESTSETKTDEPVEGEFEDVKKA